MAVQIYDRIYAKGADGYNAVVADITSWFEWDDIDSTSSPNNTIFKKYLDDANTKYLHINANLNNGYSPRITVGVYNGFQSIASGMLTDITYSKAAVTDKGLAVMTSAAAFPAASSFSGFGIYPGADPITGAQSHCVFLINSSYCYILSGDSAAATQNTVSIDKNSLGLTCAVPLCAVSTNFVVDDIQRLTIIPDGNVCLSQSITFDNKSYHRLGLLIIPE